MTDPLHTWHIVVVISLTKCRLGWSPRIKRKSCKVIWNVDVCCTNSMYIAISSFGLVTCIPISMSLPSAWWNVANSLKQRKASLVPVSGKCHARSEAGFSSWLSLGILGAIGYAYTAVRRVAMVGVTVHALPSCSQHGCTFFITCEKTKRYGCCKIH